MQKMKCKKCGYEWVPRVERPKGCPGCFCRKWDTYKEENNEDKKDR